MRCFCDLYSRIHGDVKCLKKSSWKVTDLCFIDEFNLTKEDGKKREEEEGSHHAWDQCSNTTSLVGGDVINWMT